VEGGEGVQEGSNEGIEGEGIQEGITEGIAEGEGIQEGITEGIAEGEGIQEGSIEGEIIRTYHSADKNNDGIIDLSELLRVIQFFNSGGYHCADNPEDTEDGYIPGIGDNITCKPHVSDYNPQDWQIDLGELLRLIQIFNIGHYYPCPGNSEDNFCF